VVLYQKNFVLHSGDLSTPLTTKVSMCRIYSGQIGTRNDHSSSNFVSLSISFHEFSVFFIFCLLFSE
jgi:hypothetical protein